MLKKVVVSILVIFLMIFLFLKIKDKTTKEVDRSVLYQKQIKEIKQLVTANNYNEKYAFLVDFSIHSGKDRMFLYNLETQTFEKSFLVTHGEGCGQTQGIPDTFSNTPNSLCSSVGISVINGRDYSKWGIHIKYWLDGLEETNNKMRERVVVMHSWSGVPDVEVYPIVLPQSQGCFAVSNKIMRFIDQLVQSQENKMIIISAFK